MPVRIEGSESLMRKLGALQDAVRGKMLERAVVTGALLVQNDAKIRAPYISGTLKRSIHIGGHEDENPDGEGGGLPDPEVSSTEVAVYIGSNEPYARRIEMGFSGSDRLGRTYNQPAKPYLRPALDENQAAVRQEIGAALRDLIRAAAT